METKVINPKTLIYYEGKTSLKNIVNYSNSAIEELMKEVTSSGIEINGPMEFIYFGATDDLEKEFTLQIGLPVKEKKTVGKKFNFKETSPFKCVSYQYKGDVSKMFEVYSNLYQQINQKQLQPLDEIREVYLKWEHLTSENNITEIQIGIN